MLRLGKIVSFALWYVTVAFAVVIGVAIFPPPQRADAYKIATHYECRNNADWFVCVDWHFTYNGKPQSITLCCPMLHAPTSEAEL